MLPVRITAAAALVLRLACVTAAIAGLDLDAMKLTYASLRIIAAACYSAANRLIANSFMYVVVHFFKPSFPG